MKLSVKCLLITAVLIVYFPLLGQDSNNSQPMYLLEQARVPCSDFSDLNAFFDERNSRIYQEIARIRDFNLFSPLDGIDSQYNAVKVDGSQRPDLLKMEDVLGQLAGLFRGDLERVYSRKLIERGFPPHDLKRLKNFILSRPHRDEIINNAVMEVLRKEELGKVYYLETAGFPGVEDQAIIDFLTLKNQLYEREEKRWAIELLEEFTTHGKRVLLCFVFEKFGSMNRFYYPPEISADDVTEIRDFFNLAKP